MKRLSLPLFFLLLAGLPSVEQDSFPTSRRRAVETLERNIIAVLRQYGLTSDSEYEESRDRLDTYLTDEYFEMGMGRGIHWLAGNPGVKLESFAIARFENAEETDAWVEARRSDGLVLLDQVGETKVERTSEGSSAETPGFPARGEVGSGKHRLRFEGSRPGSGWALAWSGEMVREDVNWPAGDTRTQSGRRCDLRVAGRTAKLGFFLRLRLEHKWDARGKGNCGSRGEVPSLPEGDPHATRFARLGFDLAETILFFDPDVPWDELDDVVEAQELNGLAFYRLDVNAAPSRLRVSANESARITIHATEQPADASEAPHGFPGADVRVRVVEHEGFVAGHVTPAETATGPDGKVEVTYHPPAAEDLPEGFDRVELRVTSELLTTEETVYLDFVSDAGRIFVEPHYGGAVSARAVIPADERFPATIEVRIEDDAMQGRAGVPVTLEIEGDAPVGTLRPIGGESGVTSVELVTDADGVARAHYAYTGRKVLEAPITERLVARSPEMKRPLHAEVSIGLDLRIANLEHRLRRGDAVSAGDEVPLRVTIADAFHPEAKQLGRVLNHWGSGGERGDTSLAVRLDISPAGSAPRYLYEKLALASYDNPSFARVMSLRHVPGGNTALWMPSDAWAAGWPRVKVLFSGANSFVARASLVTGTIAALGLESPEVEEKWRTNNRAVFTVPTDLPANEFVLFSLQDPFGPHTKEARVFREVLKLMGGGAILEVSRVATMVGEGNVEEVGKALVTALAGKHVAAAAAGKLDLPDGGVEFLARYIALDEVMGRAQSVIEIEKELLDDPDATRAMLRSLLDGVGRGAVALPELEGKKLVTLFGKGEQVLLDANGKPLFTAEAGRIVDAADGACTLLREGGVSVWVVPEELEVNAAGADETITHEASSDGWGF